MSMFTFKVWKVKRHWRHISNNIKPGFRIFEKNGYADIPYMVSIPSMVWYLGGNVDMVCRSFANKSTPHDEADVQKLSVAIYLRVSALIFGINGRKKNKMVVI